MVTDSEPKIHSGKRATITSTGMSIAARSGLSVASEVPKALPDTVKVAKDVRDQLKLSDTIPYALKHMIVKATKEVEVMVNCYKVLGPYLRRSLVDLRHVLKKKSKKEEQVGEQFQLFMEQFERIKAKKYAIIEAAEAKKVAIDRKRKLFQVFIDDNVRICSVETSVDLTNKMSDTQKFKRLVKELDKIVASRNFSPELKEELSDLTLQLYSTMALDGINALKARHDVVMLRNAVVKGPDADEEVRQRLNNMKVSVGGVINLCEIKRDSIENYVNDVTKMMLAMDREINEKKALLKAQKTGKESNK
ncbi:hypothetical protein GE061_013807 [Apolygus lucorum]|uniref:Uncharacterized protein n=1 Tax=Apolygus lucorum TaxID=248454 RepID=A0A8S9XNV2_APOLU|nr:hypothetical protein GE061_013807 [Apolygus lucorum]